MIAALLAGLWIGSLSRGVEACENPAMVRKVRNLVRDFNAAVKSYVAERSAGQGGLFRLLDEELGEEVQLLFRGIRPPLRKVGGGGYVACAKFESVEGRHQYDIDFSLSTTEGMWVVNDVIVHKRDGRKVSAFSSFLLSLGRVVN